VFNSCFSFLGQLDFLLTKTAVNITAIAVVNLNNLFLAIFTTPLLNLNNNIIALFINYSYFISHLC